MPLQSLMHIVNVALAPPHLIFGKVAEEEKNTLGDVNLSPGEERAILNPLESHPRSSPTAPSGAPVDRLPCELLLEVFERTLPAVDDKFLFLGNARAEEDIRENRNTLPVDLKRSRSPAVLTSVCTRWKEIAENASRLWTRLVVDDVSSHRQIHWAALHVKHSADSLLVLHIDTTQWQNPSQEQRRLIRAYCTELLHIILPHAGRWQELAICPKWLTDVQLDALLSSRTPHLTSAIGSEICEERTQQRFCRWALSSPELRRLSLDLSIDHRSPLDYPGLLGPLRTAWEGIRELNLRGTPIQPVIVLKLLRECSKLEILRVNPSSQDDNESDPNPLQVVHASNLRTLMLYLQSMPDAHALVRAIRTPSLRHLAIWDSTHHGQSDLQTRFWSAVGDMAVASRVTLKHLLFTGRVRQLADLIVRGPFRDLEGLSTNGMAVPTWFTEMMTIDDNKCHLPLLRYLSLGTCWSDTQRSLDRMVLSRRGTLNVLEIRTLVSPYDMKVLQAARMDWLVLHIRKNVCW